MPDEQMQFTGQVPSSSGASQLAGQIRADRVYETEELVLKAKMLEAEFFDKFVLLVDQEALSKRAKLALISTAAMAFDKNAILANNLDIDLRCLRFEEALNKAKLSYARPDVMNPAIVYLHENLRQSFRDFVSRSYQMGERRMQGEKKIIQGVYNVPESEFTGKPQEPRKHGFGPLGEILSGGKGGA